ncbi:hypothetical protein Fcan01_28275 [Folsomia candida]|uniref:Uncharacterized protein n=1 Tax=Folsomia candida TaxID=158441 RepID=A0A226CWT4_FOLCA|nr:hypothetical protein Fcan01_28275 [Folsomia candida]
MFSPAWNHEAVNKFPLQAITQRLKTIEAEDSKFRKTCRQFQEKNELKISKKLDRNLISLTNYVAVHHLHRLLLAKYTINGEKKLLEDFKQRLEFQKQTCRCILYYSMAIPAILFLPIIASHPTFGESLYDKVIATPAHHILPFWTKDAIIYVFRVILVSSFLLFLVTNNYLPRAYISSEASSAAIAERRRKSWVLQMMASTTVMSIPTIIRNIEFDHLYTPSFLEIMVLEPAYWFAMFLRDVMPPPGPMTEEDEVTQKLIDERLSKSRISYLYDPEDDPVSHLLLYTSTVAVLVLTFPLISYLYCTLTRIHLRKPSEIIRVQKFIAERVYPAIWFCSLLIWGWQIKLPLLA